MKGAEQQSAVFGQKFLYTQSKVSGSTVAVEKSIFGAPLFGSFSPHIFR
jgi:hypothetical protein